MFKIQIHVMIIYRSKFAVCLMFIQNCFSLQPAMLFLTTKGKSARDLEQLALLKVTGRAFIQNMLHNPHMLV